jgi:tetrathionate reductase subunit C
LKEPIMQIIELLTPAYDVAWLPWAVQYFFLVGIAATCALTAAGIALIGRPSSDSWRLLPALATVLAVTAIAAPVSLLADLHQPARFWHFYAYFTPWSWMSLGAYLLPVFVGLSLAFCLAWWLGRVVLLRVLAMLLVLSALSILVYTGSEVMAVRSRPLWNTMFLPLNFALTGWLATLGAVLLVGRLLPGGMEALPLTLLRRLAWAAVLALAVGALLWGALGLMGREPSFDAARLLFARFPVWRLGFYGSVVAGLLVIALLRAPARTLLRPGYSLLLALIMLASPWMFRWIIFMAVQGVPKYGAGLYLYRMPMGSDGLLGMLGVFGLCIALLSAVTYLIARFPAKATLTAPHAGH